MQNKRCAHDESSISTAAATYHFIHQYQKDRCTASNFQGAN
jgi:hypothetical protein